MLSRALLPLGLGAAFRCQDGSGPELLSNAVNDDFCDCSDGSDEPGTGACAGQETALFVCQNTGSTPQRLYASRVRDGICDCCDGTDEAPPLSRLPPLIACPNTCEEQGGREKAERQEQARILKAGLEKQAEIKNTIKDEMMEWVAEKQQLTQELPRLEAKYNNLKKAREERSAAEKTAESAKSDESHSVDANKEDTGGEANSRESLDLAEASGKPAVSEYTKWMEDAESAVEKAGIDNVEKGVSEYTAWMEGAEQEFSREFVATVPKKDGKLGMAVKFESRICRVSEVVKASAVEDWNHREGQKHAIAKGDCVLRVNDVAVHTEKEFREHVGTDPVVLSIDKECEATYKTTSTTTTTRYTFGVKEDPEEREAGDGVKTKKDRIKDLQKKLDALEDDKLGYASLLGKTLERKVGEHNYKISFFEKAEQGYTSLGSWKGWTGAHAAEFTDGASCWQGSPRQLSVSFHCGLEAELLDVAEPSRCVYAATLTHPGACEESNLDALANPPTRGPRDEL